MTCPALHTGCALHSTLYAVPLVAVQMFLVARVVCVHQLHALSCL